MFLPTTAQSAVRGSNRTDSSLCYRSPGVTRRVYPEARGRRVAPLSTTAPSPISQSGVRTFLPFTLRYRKGPKGSPPAYGYQGKPAITRPARHVYYTVSVPGFCSCSPQTRSLKSSSMNALEAKDFLVQETAKQAALEGVPFSDLEKRMMYFTETDECPEDPIALNEEFEAKYDTNEYEEKISKLLKHAYKRVSKESDATRKTWDAAVKRLRRGDHYILVMCDVLPGISPAGPVNWRVYAITASIVAIVVGLWVGLRWIGDHLAPPDPRIVWAVLVVLAFGAILFKSQLLKVVDSFLELLFGQEKEKNSHT